MVVADSVLSSGSLGDGQRLVFEYGNSLWLGTGEGRDAKRIAKPDSARHIYRYRWPEVLPGGTHALVTIDRFPTANVVDSLGLAVVSLSDGTVTELGVFGTNPHYVEPGRIVFGRAGGLVFSAPFSLRRRQVTGAAELLLQGVWQGDGGATGVAVSRLGGVLAFHSGTAHIAQLVIVDRSGVAHDIPGEPALFRSPRVSPDGRRVAVEIGALASPANWILDLTTHALTPLSPDSASIRPEWTRDGSQVVFQRRLGSNGISSPWDRSGPARVLWTKPGVIEVSPGPIGGYWAFGISSVGDNDIWIAPSDSLNAMRPFVKTSAIESLPRMSPNGRLMAYASNETGRVEVYVSPVPGPGPRVSVSIGGGDEPIWSPDGTTLFYRGPTRLMSAMIVERPQLGVARRDSLFVDSYERNAAHADYDVLANGREFIMLRSVRDVRGSDVNVIMNWRSTGAPSVPRGH
jgi:WD40-like Beta Propeller Repeat